MGTSFLVVQSSTVTYIVINLILFLPCMLLVVKKYVKTKVKIMIMKAKLYEAFYCIQISFTCFAQFNQKV